MFVISRISRTAMHFCYKQLSMKDIIIIVTKTVAWTGYKNVDDCT